MAINNRTFHRWPINGIDVEYKRPDGSIAGDKVRLIDFEDPGNNDWVAINQFTVIEGGAPTPPRVLERQLRPRPPQKAQGLNTLKPAPARAAYQLGYKKQSGDKPPA